MLGLVYLVCRLVRACSRAVKQSKVFLHFCTTFVILDVHAAHAIDLTSKPTVTYDVCAVSRAPSPFAR